MPGKAITIGPFSGGLNNISLAGEARDSEVVDLINLETTVDNALTSRPPIEAIASSTLPTTNTIGWEVLGIYRISNSEWHLVVSAPKDGTTNTDTTVKMYQNGIIGTGETVTIIKQSVGLANRVTAMVQFKDYLYFNVDTGATDTAFRWKKGDAIGGTTIPTMPKGSVMITWKTRIWVSGTGTNTNGDRVFFSDIDANGPHPETWPTANNFDVAPGEGGFVTALIPSFNNLIVFKNDGTWRYSFPSDPGKGSVDKISGAVGCSGRNAVVDFENYIYVYDQGRVYELVNSNYTQINRFVKFSEDAFGVDAIAPGVELSVVNRRLLVRYFNSIYCFSIDSKGWSQWRSYNGVPGEFIELPTDSSSSAPSTFIAASWGQLQSGKANYLQDPTFGLQSTKDFVQANAGAAFPCTFAAGVLTATHTGASASIRLAFPGTGNNLTGNSVEDFADIVAGAGQRFKWTYDHTRTGTITGSLTAVWLAKDGSVSSTGVTITAGTAQTALFTAPNNTVRARFYFKLDNFLSTDTITFSNMKFERTTDSSPYNLIRITDTYPDQVADFEVIECSFQTKSYDYKAPGNFKRMYWAGMDVKASLPITAETRPVSRVLPVTWGQLESYTWDQLQQGVWGNPLSWLNTSVAEIDLLPQDMMPSENGRYFKKFGVGMRFRQVSYVIRMNSWGNKLTGPIKFFTITTYVNTKQEVVDAST